MREITELTIANMIYTSDIEKSYGFNTELNSLLVKVLMNTGQLVAGESYDLNFDHQFMILIAKIIIFIKKLENCKEIIIFAPE